MGDGSVAIGIQQFCCTSTGHTHCCYIPVPGSLGGPDYSLSHFCSLTPVQDLTPQRCSMTSPPLIPHSQGLFPLPTAPFMGPWYLWHSHQGTAASGCCWSDSEPSTVLASPGRGGRNHSRCHLCGSEWHCSHAPERHKHMIRTKKHAAHTRRSHRVTR